MRMLCDKCGTFIADSETKVPGLNYPDKSRYGWGKRERERERERERGSMYYGRSDRGTTLYQTSIKLYITVNQTSTMHVTSYNCSIEIRGAVREV